MRQVLRAILVVNLQKNNAQAAAEEICGELKRRGVALTVFTFKDRFELFPDGQWDIAFSLGGDGTVLYAARVLAAGGTPILPIQLGTLGFLAGVERYEWLSVYEQWLNETARLSQRCMFSISVSRGGCAVFSGSCLNDMVISSLGNAKLILLRLKTETSPGESVPDGHVADLGCYRSDGLIVATPTGSTAYSMAAGGPIVDPEMEALIISPICPFTLSNRPLVLPSRHTLLVTVEKEQRSSIVLTVDGQEAFDLQPDDTVTINQSLHYARLITAGRSSYYSKLKGKLSWGEGSAFYGGGNA